MKQNVFLSGIIETISKDYIRMMESEVPNLLVTNNFEQVKAMAKLGELGRLCIYHEAYNYSSSEMNMMRGQRAAEEIHKIDPSIEILVWDGREYKKEDGETLPVELVNYGKPLPVKSPNEVYVDGEIKIDDATTKFLKGDITIEDIKQSIL